MSFLEILQKTKKRMYNICFVPARKSAHFLLGQPKPWFNFAVVMLAEWGRHSQSSSWAPGLWDAPAPPGWTGGPCCWSLFPAVQNSHPKAVNDIRQETLTSISIYFFLSSYTRCDFRGWAEFLYCPHSRKQQEKKLFKFWGSSIFFTCKSVNFKSGFISVHCRHSRNLWFI